MRRQQRKDSNTPVNWDSAPYWGICKAIRTIHFTHHPASIAGDRVGSFSVTVDLVYRHDGFISPCKWTSWNEIYR